ncbi:hypothetical protein M3223_08705 [Paenibacillus pasadenensis]|uniref:hypothetical protein n=1 Tax=Paenibacillus pasadenensis TaxID=217090 RepID=UPI002040FD78|nr:hypothetical protein [Paenibacillus pasadenensis]MCM3747433.1 hypothetical protein [Paenibacillus pasadenensis]
MGQKKWEKYIDKDKDKFKKEMVILNAKSDKELQLLSVTQQANLTALQAYLTGFSFYIAVIIVIINVCAIGAQILVDSNLQEAGAMYISFVMFFGLTTAFLTLLRLNANTKKAKYYQSQIGLIELVLRYRSEGE